MDCETGRIQVRVLWRDRLQTAPHAGASETKGHRMAIICVLEEAKQELLASAPVAASDWEDGWQMDTFLGSETETLDAGIRAVLKAVNIQACYWQFRHSLE